MSLGLEVSLGPGIRGTIAEVSLLQTTGFKVAAFCSGAENAQAGQNAFFKAKNRFDERTR